MIKLFKKIRKIYLFKKKTHMYTVYKVWDNIEAVDEREAKIKAVVRRYDSFYANKVKKL